MLEEVVVVVVRWSLGVGWVLLVVVVRRRRLAVVGSQDGVGAGEGPLAGSERWRAGGGELVG